MNINFIMMILMIILLLLTICNSFHIKYNRYINNNNKLCSSSNDNNNDNIKRRDDELARANRISYLLNNAVQMIKFKSNTITTTNNNDTIVTITTTTATTNVTIITTNSTSTINTNTNIIIDNNITSKVLKPLDMSFSSSHRVKIFMNDSIAAQRYLSLPTSNYSLLNSNVISRSDNDSDTFQMSLPLGDLTSVTGITISAILKTSIKVIPDTDKGKLTFQSGPFYFLPTLKNNTSSSINNISNDDVDLQKGLPEWLLWGGEQGENGEVKSSIQAGFTTELAWKPPSIESTNKNENSNDQLLVNANVKVFVDLNVPIREDLARAISFLPVKILLQQAGSLTMNAALRSIAPTFSELLKKDHDKRRNINVNNNIDNNSDSKLLVDSSFN